MGINESNVRLPIEDHIARALKVLRRKKGLTLEECDSASGGKFKAVVLGSYERGTRAVSISKLNQLSEFYDVPVSYFFSIKNVSTEGKWVFDLRRLRESDTRDFPINFISNSLGRIAALRADWEGEILSIRESDRECFEIIFGDEREKLIEGLKAKKIILERVSERQSP